MSTRRPRHLTPPTTAARGIALAAVLAVAVPAALAVRTYLRDDTRRHYLAADGWPAQGQAAYALGLGPDVAGPGQNPAPIASLAKVMTAYLVLAELPLRDGDDGPRLLVTAADVAQTAVRRTRDESVVPVRTGEELTERQALMALLLPSANNIAVVLARFAAGSVERFVLRMNAAAARLGMAHTIYTDPSGFDPETRSTAADQLRLAHAAAAVPQLARMMATRSYRLPVAGVVHNTDVLLGHDGFVGMKTGSDDAAGGCFMFRARRTLDGRTVDLIGVVMGQSGHDLVQAGQLSARQLADAIAPAA